MPDTPYTPITPCSSPQQPACPQHKHKQRPPRSPHSVLAPLAGSFKIRARKLVYTQQHVFPTPLDLGLPLQPARASQHVDVDVDAHAAREAFHTLCLQTD